MKNRPPANFLLSILIFDIQSAPLGNTSQFRMHQAGFSACGPLRFLTLHRGEKRQMAKTVCKIMGVVFLLVGVCGFAAPTLLGAHLTPPHNLVHIVSGVIALYFGFAGSLSGARGFCLVFGIVYLALGILGLTLGDKMMDRMWHVGPLTFGYVDHGIHLLLGVVFLAGGLFTRKQ
jgi:hypothetical protein